MKIKVCGVRTMAAARACDRGGADMAGLNFVSTSRRRVDVRGARGLLPALGAVTPVGVFMDQPGEEVAAVALALGLSWVQLHGAEGPELCRGLAGRFSVIKALTADEALDSDLVAAYAPHVCAFLVDGRAPGSGRAWRWSRLASFGGVVAGRPLWLAGGLCPESVAGAVVCARPKGVDVASGVETDGEQDEARIVAFCEAARSHKGEEAP